MFVQFLLIGVFGAEKIAGDILEPKKLQFVEEVFQFRVHYNPTRYSNFNSFIDTIKKQFVHKLNKC